MPQPPLWRAFGSGYSALAVQVSCAILRCSLQLQQDFRVHIFGGDSGTWARDVKRCNDLTRLVADWDCDRTEPYFEFLIYNAPALRSGLFDETSDFYL